MAGYNQCIRNRFRWKFGSAVRSRSHRMAKPLLRIRRALGPAPGSRGRREPYTVEFRVLSSGTEVARQSVVVIAAAAPGPSTGTSTRSSQPAPEVQCSGANRCEDLRDKLIRQEDGCSLRRMSRGVQRRGSARVSLTFRRGNRPKARSSVKRTFTYLACDDTDTSFCPALHAQE